MTKTNTVEIAKNFKRKIPKGPRIICKFCGDEIEITPCKGITKRRVDHLNGCEKFNCELDEIKHLPNEYDNITIGKEQDDYFPELHHINPPDEYDDTIDDDVMYILLTYVSEVLFLLFTIWLCVTYIFCFNYVQDYRASLGFYFIYACIRYQSVLH